MQFIGKRISYVENKEELSVLIIGSLPDWRRWILLLWLVAWTACGVVVLSQYSTLTDESAKVATIVWIAFWAYFEFKVYKATVFRFFGKEKIWLKHGKLNYRREVRGQGKTESFEFDFIKNLRVIEAGPNDFLKTINNSYWIVAGERIGFDYYGKEIKTGLQLSETEALQVVKLVKNSITKLERVQRDT